MSLFGSSRGSSSARKSPYTNVNKKKQSRKKKIIVFFIIILFPLLPAFIFRIMGFYPVTVDSDAMQKAIGKGDTVILKEGSYSPKNNDIVVVGTPAHRQPMICRIVAIEGQEIRIEDKMVYVNNQKINGGKTDDVLTKDQPILEERYARRDNLATVRLPLEHYFCLNDNRSNLFDSRVFGLVQKQQITAKVLFKSFFQKIP